MELDTHLRHRASVGEARFSIVSAPVVSDMAHQETAAERVEALEDQLREEKEEHQVLKDACKLKPDDLMNCFIKKE